MEEIRNEESRKDNTRHKKLEKALERSFVLGAISCMLVIVAVVAVMRILGIGGLLVGDAYKDYTGMLKDCGKYYQMTQMIKDEALNDYKPDGIDDKILRDVVKQLDDPYARYFTAEEYEAYLKAYDSSFVGIGVRYSEEDGKIIVHSVVDGGPAQEAGVKAGDQLIKADGKELKNSDDAQSKLLGEAGTSVKLTVLRNGRTIEFDIVRSEIEAGSVSYKVMDKKRGIGHLYVSIFGNDTAKDFKLAVKDLKNQGCDKIIIDLRNNGGGLTKEAYKVADYLLPAGIIDTEKNKDGKETVHKSKDGDAGVKYVLLVNGNTASASELVAAAVQDNNGGKIIGTKTYGKGVTQVMRKFKDGSAVKFTISEYFRPSGKKVNKVGVTPDIVEKGNSKMLELAVRELTK